MSRKRQILYASLMAAALGAVGAPAMRLAAQQSLRKGERVRVVSPPATPGQPDSVATGNLVRFVNDTLVIDAGWTGLAHRVLAFDMAGGAQLQVLQGGHPHLWTIVGAMGGGLIVGTLAHNNYHQCCYLTRSGYTFAGAIVGMTSGALIGVLIDSRYPGGHWVPVDTHGVQVSLGRGGLGVRATF